jgi:hypothetical protein
MLKYNQHWILFPDDVEQVHATLKKGGFRVLFNGDNWLISDKKVKTRHRKQKEFTLVKDGPFAGARVEYVCVEAADLVAELLKDKGYFAVKTKDSDTGPYIFVGLRDKQSVYADRMNRRLVPATEE